MTTQNEALKLALDFLMTRRMGAELVIDALQEALAQPEPEQPVPDHLAGAGKPIQPEQEPSQFGSPKMQALILAKLAQPEQEPAAHIATDALNQMKPPMLALHGVTLLGYNGLGTTAVYTTQPKRKPLTDELETLFTNIDHAISSGAWNVQTGSQTWEIIEEAKAAHGIKELNT
jgi:hypothetical protein